VESGIERRRNLGLGKGDLDVIIVDEDRGKGGKHGSRIRGKDKSVRENGSLSSGQERETRDSRVRGEREATGIDGDGGEGIYGVERSMSRDKLIDV
jgi:hypothetical protein